MDRQNEAMNELKGSVERQLADARRRREEAEAEYLWAILGVGILVAVLLGACAVIGVVVGP